MSAVAGLLAMLLEEEGSSGGGGISGTPLDYGDLVAFLDAENGVTGNPDVTQWQDQGSAINFTLPSGQRSPEFLSATQEGLPGINFAEASGGSGTLRRKLESSDAVFDNYFSGSGNKSIAFAARLDDLVNSFSTTNTIMSKGFVDSGGWRLSVLVDGTLVFSHRRSNGSTWELSVSGFYSQGDLVLGSVTYNGGNTSGSGSFRIFDGTNFITAGSVSIGSAGGIGVEAAENLVVGNIIAADVNNNAPFGGPIFGVWMVKPASTVFDEGYMQRWIP